MLGLNKNIFISLGVSFSVVALVTIANSKERRYSSLRSQVLPADTGKKKKTSAEYKPTDRYGDPYSDPPSKSPFILPLPKNVETDVILDDSMKTYTIEEKVGDLDYRPPSTMTFEEYYKYKNRETMKNYWKNKTSGDSSVAESKNDAFIIRKKISNSGRTGPFGSDYVELRPTGLVTLDFGARWQRVNNPNIPVRQQRQGQFDFDQSITMNVVGKIGEKLKLTVNWDTKAPFEYQNKLKLQYIGFEEDIIQSIEAGNVSLPLNSTLISGAQNLFGVKTKLQFGRLTTTTVLSTQRGKVEELRIQGGAMTKDFEIKADKYDDNRHFFLSHFFRDNYEKSLKNLPMVNSGVKINPGRVEVWITNRVNNTKDLRNIVAYTDLGEPDTTDMFNNSHYKVGIPQEEKYPADNQANTLYQNIKSVRKADQVSSTLEGPPYNLVRGSDFEIINQARKLNPTEYKLNPDLGYISLNTPLRNDELLAVAYEYGYDGKTYKVGEVNEDYQSIKGDSVIILKLIKPSTVKPDLETFDLMMKNIYQLGTTQISRDNFQLRVIYKNDITGADLPNLQEGQNTTNIPLLRLTGLDRLNPNNDPFFDGNFDFVEDITIDSKYGRIIFPVLEPFGSNMAQYFDPVTEQNLINKYVYNELYEKTKSDAEQIATKDKYFLKGKYQGSSSSEIILPGINIAPGSVTVLAGSTPLMEGTDYDIDYNLGRIKIKNQGVLQSNKEIIIRFEKTDLINFRRKSFIGSRFDYKINRDFFVGATLLHQTESPPISRVNIGDEPSKNTIIGLDGNFKTESRLLTKAVDKLPLIQTKAISTITFAGEGAVLLPGYPKILDKSLEEQGTSYIDDFEGAETPYDLTRIPTKWRLGATPLRFAEAQNDSLPYTYRRAKLAWYSVDNIFFQGNEKPEDFKNDFAYYLQNHFVRQIGTQEVFPNKQLQQIPIPETTLDLAFYPAERGSYNYNPDPTVFTNPSKISQNWGAVTREIRNDIDFDNANIQYIEFWMMDPFMTTKFGELPLTLDSASWAPVTQGGQLFFNLGSISEDIMKDSKHAFENGLPVSDADASQVTNNEWGKVTNKQFLTNAFDNSTDARSKQDIGLDGLNNDEERNKFLNFSNVVDPSADDFKYYLDESLNGKGVLERYKDFNGLDGNSPLNTGKGFTPASSTLPDNEDLNANNTLDELEEYYEYKIDINKAKFVVGQNHVIDKTDYTDKQTGETVTWYQFRIPIREPDSTVGAINGFKSIRFMRMYMTGFTQPIVLRMVQFQMVANQWRVYQQGNLDPADKVISSEPSDAVLTVSTVNIEENGKATQGKSAYVLPPGFKRDQDATSQTYRQLNEQSIQLCIDDLEDNKAKAAYKNVNLNLINYDKVKAFLHAESKDALSNEMNAFLRLGTDYTQNYYEIEVPLTMTPYGSLSAEAVWPGQNLIDINIKDLIAAKTERNSQVQDFANYQFPFTRSINGRNITVVGNPDISAVQVLMLGLRNPKSSDKAAKSACIWMDELRVTGFNSNPAYATTARMNIKLADLANVNLSGKYTTVGWGSLEQKVSQRERYNTGEWGASSSIALDKFIPQKIGLKIPMYVSYDQKIISPKYDPLDPDVILKKSLESISNDEERQKYKQLILDRRTTRSINFTNVQKIKTNREAKSHIYDIENLSFTTAYSQTCSTNAMIANYNQTYYKGGVNYTYSLNSKNYEPFKNVKFVKSPYLRLIKDFNFSLLPSSLTFSSSLDRRFTRRQYYEGSPNPRYGPVSFQNPFFEKQFTFVRNYGLNWSLTKSLTFDYKANAYAIVDEPNRDPEIDKERYRDSIWSNVLRGGRLKNFDHNISLNYKLPLDKLPLTDWIAADAKYSSGFMWTSGALIQRDTMGNLIHNNQTSGITGKINLEKIYNKVKFLKDINNPPPPQKPTAKDTSKTLPKPELKGLKATLKGIMLVKSINFNYELVRNTGMAGYLPIPKYFGLTPGDNPYDMLPFILGSQDPAIRKTISDNNWLSRSRQLNTPFTQGRQINFSARTQIEPIKDFRIQLDVMKKKGTNYQELYRIDTAGKKFVSESPSRNGSLSLSVVTIRTMFRGKVRSAGDPNSSRTFEDFEYYRGIIWDRIGSSSLDTNSQNVLIPAFLAAYTKKDPGKISLNPFPKVPLPNWRIDYSGITKIKAIGKLFPSFTISHGYTSVYSIGAYNSSLRYGSDTINPYTDITNAPLPGVFNGNGVLIPVFIIDGITITEALNPLLGVNFRTKNKLTGRIEFKKSRTLTLNLTNAQLQEITSNDVTLGFGVIKNNTKIPFFKRMAPLKNELNAKMDVTISDRKTVQRKFEESATLTAGNLNFQLRPSITYAINSRLNAMIYFERIVNAPKISSSFRMSSTRFGVQLRFTLS
ncbi:MAG: cell surface protein SprA [Cytophagaceae bacterium]|nr:cell surface protein SprA [Cytophagaceae bacterium]